MGAALKDLEVRGYIAFASAKDSLNSLTMPQLKEMLSTKELPTTGKKSDLVLRVADAFSEAELTASGIQVKYMLTDLGPFRQEAGFGGFDCGPYAGNTCGNLAEPFGVCGGRW